MLKSDLLNEETVNQRIDQITKTMKFIIFYTPEDAKEDAMDHLKTLAFLQMDLEQLSENLPCITYNESSISN